ncbi:3-oxo-5-alpha-steroid 4-dehydrogenase family protein [Aspergillus ibericus CBS 121593]|uniref:Uncharacterized protein n=1 Tax=Aspergillus ibericus CBS 121593 TaxID=1448316 RepID=A0A395HD68_9EURO|nr:hypothetical protein BO80DRAFT_421033 [Aspergillus ibericus CBS 121593]RAL05827.1 hypothetical protein BO80DRAFT_421033 [Aspergillus ibericus CBS 121593]
MGTAISCIQALPPLDTLLHPPPETYAQLINIFQYFPAISLIQWLTSFHPAGKTSLKSSPLNLPGRWAWFTMEIISPLNLLYLLTTLPQKYSLPPLPPLNKFLAALFVLHYINRAIISPFFAAPSMSPIHGGIVLAAGAFNWFNSACLAGWLVGYPLSLKGLDGSGTAITGGDGVMKMIIGKLGLILFILGMACNIHAERTLFRLRREEALRRLEKNSSPSPSTSTSTPTIKDTTPQNQQKDQQENDNGNRERNIYHKIYTIPPPTGLFTSILYPHYVAEWIEWTGFALLGACISPTSPILNTLGSRPTLHLAPWLVPAAKLASWAGVGFPVPAVVFVVNAVTNMLPHARWGRVWYVERFGERVQGRGAVVPFVSWL